MEFIPSSTRAKLSDFITQSKEEILFFLPSLETCAPFLPLLIRKAEEGLKVKILVRASIDKKSPTYNKIHYSNIELKSVGQRNMFGRNLISHSEIWILDRKIALLEQPKFSEIGTLCMRDEDVAAMADYFLHYWSKVSFFGARFSYFIRQKKFSFQAGRGCLQDLLSTISRAENEVYIAVPRTSKRLTAALLQARKNGASVTLITSSLKKNRFSRLRWFIRTHLLKRADVQLIQVSHRNLDFLALVDKKTAYFGSCRLDFWGRNKMETSLGIFEPQICLQFSEIIEKTRQQVI